MAKSTIGDALWSEEGAKKIEDPKATEDATGSWADALSKPPKQYKNWEERRAHETGAINAPNDFVFIKGGCVSDRGDFYHKSKVAWIMNEGAKRGIDPATVAAMAVKEGFNEQNPLQLDIGQHAELLKNYKPIGMDKKGYPIYNTNDLVDASLRYYQLCLKLENGDEQKAIARYNGKGETVGEKGARFHGVHRSELGKTEETKPGNIHASRVMGIKKYLLSNKEIKELINGILGIKPKQGGK